MEEGGREERANSGGKDTECSTQTDPISLGLKHSIWWDNFIFKRPYSLFSVVNYILGAGGAGVLSRILLKPDCCYKPSESSGVRRVKQYSKQAMIAKPTGKSENSIHRHLLNRLFVADLFWVAYRTALKPIS